MVDQGPSLAFWSHTKMAIITNFYIATMKEIRAFK